MKLKYYLSCWLGSLPSRKWSYDIYQKCNAFSSYRFKWLVLHQLPCCLRWAINGGSRRMSQKYKACMHTIRSASNIFTYLKLTCLTISHPTLFSKKSYEQKWTRSFWTIGLMGAKWNYDSLEPTLFLHPNLASNWLWKFNMNEQVEIVKSLNSELVLPSSSTRATTSTPVGQ